MIEKNTVLVLGAGASCPFGFPIGRELVKIIIRNLGPSGDLLRILINHGFDEDWINSFKDALLGAEPLSIDTFLEHRPDFEKIGKEAIAGSLLPYEHLGRFNTMLLQDENNWYRYLFNRLNTSFDDFALNQLSVITFNYDRSFEHYLFSVLKNTYNKTEEECAEKLKSIPVIHVHGSLGSLIWQESSLSSVSYGIWSNKRYKGQAVKQGGENIIIVHEANKETPEFQKAHQLLSQADYVYFLGFGFNRDNVRRLRIEILLNKVVTRGTAFKLPLQERKYICSLKMAGNGRWNNAQNLTNGFFDLDCYNFLEKQVVFE
ncbi:MAG TPA: hypothetical protein ENH94_11100 [Phycisphaerales bacterium]|nr:hypothetical protein [Phycisphaerales bacterium]